MEECLVGPYVLDGNFNPPFNPPFDPPPHNPRVLSCFSARPQASWVIPTSLFFFPLGEMVREKNLAKAFEKDAMRAWFLLDFWEEVETKESVVLGVGRGV